MDRIKIYEKACMTDRDNRRKPVRWIFALTLAFLGFFAMISADLAGALGNNPPKVQISVTLEPQDARNAGAQWSLKMTDPDLGIEYGPFTDRTHIVDVTADYDGGDIEVATWAVSFKTDVPGWIAPSSPVILVIEFPARNTTTKTVYGTYSEDTTPSSTTTTTTTTSTTITSTTSTTTSTTSTTSTTLPHSGCLDISDTPLDTQLQAAPATIMFVVDDSGSMDFEMMTEEDGGTIWSGSHEYFFVFDMSDNEYDDYYELSGSDRNLWRSQWAGYNRMYYNPEITYFPWPTASGRYSDASLTNPKSAPWSSTSDTLDLDGNYSEIGSLDVKNAHYYVWSDTESTMYLVNFDSVLKYYKFNSFSTEDANHNHYLDTGEDEDSDGLIDYSPTNAYYADLTRDYSPPDDIVPKKSDGSDRSFTEELQNFANWFSFYRRRELTSKNAMGNVLVGLQGCRWAFIRYGNGYNSRPSRSM